MRQNDYIRWIECSVSPTIATVIRSMTDIQQGSTDTAQRALMLRGATGQIAIARLVAAMKLNGIIKILTLNATDFTRYENIEALHSQSVKP